MNDTAVTMSFPAPTPVQTFLTNTVADFSLLRASDPARLHLTSDALCAAFRANCHTDGISMLPSFMYLMPDGSESGTSVAVDLGGSTLRVAVTRLYSRARRSSIEAARKAPKEASIPTTHKSFADVKCRRSWLVDTKVKRMAGVEFFDWIVERIAQVLETAGEGDGNNLSMGLTWSFPVMQTSLASGEVKQMGKGYEMWSELAGTDLKAHFESAFSRRGLKLRMTALLNDAEATLLSHAHTSPATRVSLIWGTGINGAMPLPVSALADFKLKNRPAEWSEVAKSVLVNTEFSIYGADFLPYTDADRLLDAASNAPGFQPLEQMTSGMYLGEIVRLTLVKGVQDGLLFQGCMPVGLTDRWNFGTDVMSELERSTAAQAGAVLSQKFGFTVEPSAEEIYAIQRLCLAVSERAALIIAVSVFSLWRTQRDANLDDGGVKDPVLESKAPIVVSYCGAVSEKHCSVRERCQQVLDVLTESEPLRESDTRRRLVLEHADDSGLLGAAVAAVMNKPDGIHTRNRSISRL